MVESRPEGHEKVNHETVMAKSVTAVQPRPFSYVSSVATFMLQKAELRSDRGCMT